MRCMAWLAWTGAKLLCSLLLLNIEIIEKLQSTKLLALETKAGGNFNAQRKSLKSPKHLYRLKKLVLYGDTIP